MRNNSINAEAIGLFGLGIAGLYCVSSKDKNDILDKIALYDKINNK